jgi:hypothetical protein
MPYKDPEKRKAYHKAYIKDYQPAWRKKHPTYNANYLREWRKENPGDNRSLEDNVIRQKLYQENNREKVSARKKLQYAVKAGKVSKPLHCESCRQNVPVQADHHDYTKPYEVTWLCRPCHLELTVRRLRLGLDL